MYEEITDVFPGDVANEINGVKYYKPMMIYPAIHYTMGGIWVDYELQTSIPGLFAIGECNFSDHGANRLGASALMQGLADGYFVSVLLTLSTRSSATSCGSMLVWVAPLRV